MAMVFQSYAIYPHMTVRENIAFPLKLAGLDRAEIDARVSTAAAILELEACLERKPRALSGGQRQRVAMGRAVVREPAVFLLDEPLSNLDAKLRVQMRTEIARLQRRLGTTTVYVTHDQTEALTLGDRIAVLRKGEVLQVGTPRELYEHPASLFVAGFVGSPAMNFLPGRWAAGRLELPGGSLTPTGVGRGALALSDGPLVAGFRPEHLRLLRDGDAADAGLVLSAEVEFVEWLGADLFVHFGMVLDGFEAVQLPDDLDIPSTSREGRSFIARVDPAASLQEGDMIRLLLEPDRVQLFDARSGENLIQAGRAGAANTD
jgi:multiple sugar transport system ATP-binding protein